MIIYEDDREVTISESNWTLAEPLFSKWGYEGETQIKVNNLDDITLELSAWGIPWKRTKWSY